MQRSPCFDCIRKNEDKQACAKICERLRAYQKGGAWKLYPIPDSKVIEKQIPPKDEDEEATAEALAKIDKIIEQKSKKENTKSKKGKQMTKPIEENSKDEESNVLAKVISPSGSELVERDGVCLDFTLYPELLAAISARAQALMLPESHIIITLVAEALSGNKGCAGSCHR